MSRRPPTLAIYCGDAGYLFPMLVSARSLRAGASAANFDIRIFAIDLDAERFAQARAIAATFAAEVVPLASSEYAMFDRAAYDATNPHNFASSSLARLVSGRFIEPDYQRVLYVDGDTLCVGDFSELAAHEIPAGRMYAVPDPANYWRFDRGPVGREKHAYMTALGLGADETYYNSGVVYADRAAWAEMGEVSLAYFAANMARCAYRDQSALNAVGRGRILPMSARWNFMQPMRAWGLDDAIPARLCHFTGPEKPWRGRMRPWTDFEARYRAFRAEPALGPLAPPLASPDKRRALNRANLLWTAKAYTLQWPRTQRARRAVLDSERRAPF